MLNSLLGISIPTALLPGIGASIRMLRAASAIARSSGSASIRLSLMCGAGWTSYWVTTGPALRPMIRASMSKLASLRTMISSFRAWTRSALSVVAAVGTSPGSSRSWGGRRHSMASRVGGESEASVTSSGPRATGSTGSPTAVLAAASAPAAAPAARAGANVDDVGEADGTALGIAGSRLAPSPRRRSARARPRTGSATRGPSRPWRRRPRPRHRRRARHPSRWPAAGRAVFVVRSWSVEPATLASPVAGASIDRSGRSNAISSPATSSSSDSTNAPGAVSSGCRRPTRKRPIRPPVHSLNAMSWSRPRRPA